MGAVLLGVKGGRYQFTRKAVEARMFQKVSRGVGHPAPRGEKPGNYGAVRSERGEGIMLVFFGVLAGIAIGYFFGPMFDKWRFDLKEGKK